MTDSSALRVAITLTCLAAVGGVSLAIAMPWSAGLSPDSVHYIAAARNLLEGRGFSVSFNPEQFAPMTHYPPLYPALLAGLGWVGREPWSGAGWLNAVLFGTNIILVGAMVGFATRSFWPAVFAACFMMTAPPMVLIHSMAWSEPLFLAFMLVEVILLAAYLEQPRTATLVCASLSAALAFLTRYAGAGAVVIGVVAILLFHHKEAWQKRLTDSLAFALVSCFPITAWLIRNFLLAGDSTNRIIIFHPPGTMHLEAALNAVSGWFFPLMDPSLSRWLGLLLIVVVSSCGYFLMRPESGRIRLVQLSSMLGLLVVFTVSYALVVVISLSFFDAHIPLDSRILSPLYPVVLALGLSGWTRLLVSKQLHSYIRVGIVAVGAIVFSSQAAGAGSWLHLSYRKGIGYADREWRDSPLVKRVHSFDRSVTIFTNSPEAVYILNKRPALGIPAKLNPQTQLPNGSYRTELANLRNRLQEKGVLIYFRAISWRWYLPTESELTQELELQLVAQEPDGAIYGTRVDGTLPISSDVRN